MNPAMLSPDQKAKEAIQKAKRVMFCCKEGTKDCCAKHAAEALQRLHQERTLSPLKENSPVENEDPPEAVITTVLTGKVCPLRRKRAVSVDFSTPCDCCPGPRITKKQKHDDSDKAPKNHTFVADLQALSMFLKKERQVLRTTHTESIEAFYQPREQDAEIVKEWRHSGKHVYVAMREKLRRLEQMEGKFGSWEKNFGEAKPTVESEEKKEG